MDIHILNGTDCTLIFVYYNKLDLIEQTCVASITLSKVVTFGSGTASPPATRVVPTIAYNKKCKTSYSDPTIDISLTSY